PAIWPRRPRHGNRSRNRPRTVPEVRTASLPRKAEASGGHGSCVRGRSDAVPPSRRIPAVRMEAYDMLLRATLLGLALLLPGCTEPFVAVWSGVQDNRYEWRWRIYGDETGEFEWYDRDKSRTREGDIEWTSDADTYEVALA